MRSLSPAEERQSSAGGSTLKQKPFDERRASPYGWNAILASGRVFESAGLTGAGRWPGARFRAQGRRRASPNHIVLISVTSVETFGLSPVEGAPLTARQSHPVGPLLFRPQETPHISRRSGRHGMDSPEPNTHGQGRLHMRSSFGQPQRH
jgi:hypothetical protein